MILHFGDIIVRWTVNVHVTNLPGLCELEKSDTKLWSVLHRDRVEAVCDKSWLNWRIVVAGGGSLCCCWVASRHTGRCFCYFIHLIYIRVVKKSKRNTTTSNSTALQFVFESISQYFAHSIVFILNTANVNSLLFYLSKQFNLKKSSLIRLY